MAHDELTRGMASIDHIHLGNHVGNRTKGLAPTSAFSHDLDHHLGNLGVMTYDGRTLRTAQGGCILEFIYVGGPESSLITGHGQALHLGG